MSLQKEECPGNNRGTSEENDTPTSSQFYTSPRALGGHPAEAVTHRGVTR